MKKIFISGILCFILFFALSAQQSSQITIEKEGLKRIYLHDGEAIDSKQLSSLLTSNPNSAAKYKSSRTNSIVGLSTMVCGTAFIGVGFYYTIKSAQTVGDNDLAGTVDYSNKSGNNMLIGAGFYVISVPFLLMANSNLKKSINLYNSHSNTGSISNLDLYVGFTGEGIGVGLKF
ncbi:MAG: hypothetical protein KAR19_19915 [Bacteroidales bacterium]|nr:hypothetical protein [Bacteroidales bacterium]